MIKKKWSGGSLCYELCEVFFNVFFTTRFAISRKCTRKSFRPRKLTSQIWGFYEKRKRASFTGKAFDQKYVNGQWKILNYFKEGRIVGTEKFAKNGEVFYESGENETAHRLKRKEGIERIKREINANWNVAALTT